MKDNVQPLPTGVAAILRAPDRLAALQAAMPVFLGPDPDFDDIVGLAACLADAPMAFVTVLGETDQWFLARRGTPDIRSPSEETFCARMLAEKDAAPLMVADACKDPRFSGLPSVSGEAHVRFYAGAPIVMDGQSIGTVAVVDRKARTAAADTLLPQLVKLASLAGILIRQKEEARRRMLAAEVLSRDEKRHALALDAANVASWMWDLTTGIVSGNETFHRMLGFRTTRPMSARSFFSAVHPADRKTTIDRLRNALATGKEYDGLFRASKSAAGCSAAAGCMNGMRRASRPSSSASMSTSPTGSSPPSARGSCCAN